MKRRNKMTSSNRNAKNVKLKSQIVFVLIAMLLLAFSFNCTSDDQGIISPELTDAKLVMAIQADGNKQYIDPEILPVSLLNTIEQDYSEEFVIDAQFAPQIGYELSMGGLGANMGNLSVVYFNTAGVELTSETSGRPGSRRHKGRKHFNLVFPVIFNMPDGTTVTVESDSGMIVLRDWREANPDSEERPSLQYPVDIVFHGETITVSNHDEMRDIYAGSRHGGRGHRFEYVYPVTYILPDSSTITIESKEGKAVIIEWYEAHPDITERPSLQFPVEVVVRNGTTKTVNSAREMHRIRKGH